jgi:hypothetical protein
VAKWNGTSFEKEMSQGSIDSQELQTNGCYYGCQQPFVAQRPRVFETFITSNHKDNTKFK